jgi:intraflagellar transport protein 122
MVMGGSDKKLTLWNKEGVLLGTVGELKDWVWASCVNPISKSIFAGVNNGTIAMFNVEFNIVHGLY